MSNHIQIKKEFIEDELPFAPPLYVCVYLMTETYPKATAAEVADRLNILESDVLKAWKYWDERNLFTKLEVVDMKSLSSSTRPIIKEIKINKAIDEEQQDQQAKQEKTLKKSKVKKEDPKQVRLVALDEKPTYKPEELAQYIKHDSLKQLIESIHKKIAKPLSHSDIATIFSFYDWLGLPIEVIDLLFAYCSKDGFKGMRYTEKVAITWADQHIRTVEAAMEQVDMRQNGYKEIMKAFGHYKRTPNDPEEIYIKKWLVELEMPLEMVVKACEKTVLNTGDTSFTYADTIILNWKKQGINSLTEIEEADRAFQEKKKTPRGNAKQNNYQTQQAPKQDKFNNFKGKPMDHDRIKEMQRKARNKW
ncbi:MAG: DnaD domain protein [Bacillota bacterium]